jgi:hypothetical protein
LGFDARELTPLLVQRMTSAAAEARSFQRAAIVRKHVGGQGVSAKTIERVAHDVGRELAERRDADPKTDDTLAQRPESPPGLAVVACDGGRIRTREPGHVPGVHRIAEGWRETKNACLIRTARTIAEDDPRPESPAYFCDPKHVAKIAETEALSVASAQPAPSPEVRGKGGPESGGSSPPMGIPSGWFAPCSAASRSRTTSASRGRAKPNDGASRKPTPGRSWGMGCPGTGRSGSSTSPTSHRFLDFISVSPIGQRSATHHPKLR